MDAVARVSRAPLRRGNRLSLLSTGFEAFEEWLSEIGRAQRWVHLENYIFWADELGQRFAEALRERAAAGVSVRVLVDWFGSMNVKREFWRGMERDGVEVRMANSPDLGSPLSALNRDHRKFLGVDGDYASTGGVCLTDGWLERSPETGLPYRDTAVGVRGPAVADLEHAFAGMWRAAGGALPAEERVRADDVAAAGETAVRVVPQEPGRPRILPLMELFALSAERRLWINEPFFLSLPRLDRSLMSAARSGVDVRVVLPATNDHPSIGGLVRTRYRRLLHSGVRVYEYEGPMMHAKTTVADGGWNRIGSTNLNPASLLACWELDLLVEDAAFSERMEALFEQDVSGSREVGLARGAPASPPAGVALQKDGTPVRDYEKTLAATVGVAALGASLASLRFPRLLAWPLAAVGAALGAAKLAVVARRVVLEALGR